MSSVAFTTEPSNRGTTFSPSAEHGMRSATHALSKSPSHNQKPDKVEISTAAREKLEQETEEQIQELEKTSKGTEKFTVDMKLSQGEQREVEKLKRVDREVRNHELAHKAAAGSVAKGGASFNYTIGPDGKKYAVGGHVNIDTSAIPNDPEATIQKAKVIRSAALAPANPSSQDQSVAATASKMESEARIELREEQEEESDDVTQVNGEENTTDVNSILQSLIQSNEDTFHSVGGSLDIQI